MEDFKKLTEEQIMAKLPTTIKTTDDVAGVYFDTASVGTGKKMLPIVPVKIPIGTILKLSVNPKDDKSILTDYMVKGNAVTTTPKQLIGKGEFVTNGNEVTTNDTKKSEDKEEVKEPKKGFFTTKNILIGVGILVAGVLVWKYVIKKN